MTHHATAAPKPSGDADLDHHQAVRGVEAVVEKWLFRHRPLVLALFFLASVFFGWQAAGLRPDASFEKMIPTGHGFIQNYLGFEDQLRPLNNQLRIAVETSEGDIYTAEFLELLKKVTDEVFYIPGVDRGNLQSIWTPNVQWFEATEDGLRSGVVVPADFDGSAASFAAVRLNVARSNRIGSLVASDHKSAVVLAPLLEIDPQTGAKLDYGLLSQRLETLVRDKYQSATVTIRITGFAKIIGDLIDGIVAIAGFFALTFVLTAGLLYWYSRCWRGTVSTLFCCTMAVVWQLGMLNLIGLGLDPYSVLAPFLTFAIGVSHAVQNINTMAAERVRGRGDLDAAKATFRLLFVPGSVALICDAVGFSTLMIIDIQVIRELAINASIGVAVVIFTKMLVLPVIMSYLGASPRGVAHHREMSRPERGGVCRALARFAEPRWALAAVAAGAALLAYAVWERQNLKIGDLDPGAPELRLDSRYNQDVAFFIKHYSTSPDVFAVIVKTPVGDCGSYPVAARVEHLEWLMLALPEVEGTQSLFGPMKRALAGSNGGDLRWYATTRNRYASNAVHRRIPGDMYNADCSMLPVLLFLQDHKAETLSRVSAAVQAFAADFNGDGVEFLLAAGNHPDVRRMLLAQKAYVEAAVGLCLYAARLVDERDAHPDAAARADAGLLLDVLTPVAKSWPSQWGVEANSLAMQVLGGYGYTRDYPVEQYFRDNRLNPIHEGAHGIQALDLLGRKVVMADGRGFQLLCAAIRASAADPPPETADLAARLSDCVATMERTTAILIAARRAAGLNVALGGASAYLEAVGHVVAAWRLYVHAAAAVKMGEDSAFVGGKLAACRWFFAWETPKTDAWFARLATLDATAQEAPVEGF